MVGWLRPATAVARFARFVCVNSATDAGGYQQVSPRCLPSRLAEPRELRRPVAPNLGEGGFHHGFVGDPLVRYRGVWARPAEPHRPEPTGLCPRRPHGPGLQLGARWCGRNTASRQAARPPETSVYKSRLDGTLPLFHEATRVTKGDVVPTGNPHPRVVPPLLLINTATAQGAPPV